MAVKEEKDRLQGQLVLNFDEPEGGRLLDEPDPEKPLQDIFPEAYE